MGENSESNTFIKVAGIIIVFLFIVHLCNKDETQEQEYNRYSDIPSISASHMATYSQIDSSLLSLNDTQQHHKSIVFSTPLTKAEDSINAAKKEAAKIDSILEARKKPLEISVSQLIAAYDANEIAADMHLKGRIISVAGVITDFGTEILGRKYVIIEDPRIPLYYVQCVFKREYGAKLAQYSKGDVISVTGECRGKGVLSDYNILMDECK